MFENEKNHNNSVLAISILNRKFKLRKIIINKAKTNKK